MHIPSRYLRGHRFNINSRKLSDQHISSLNKFSISKVDVSTDIVIAFIPPSNLSLLVASQHRTKYITTENHFVELSKLHFEVVDSVFKGSRYIGRVERVIWLLNMLKEGWLCPVLCSYHVIKATKTAD
jgi:hypothetical protein